MIYWIYEGIGKKEKKGYKAFKKGLVNHFGKEFELNKEYSVSGEIKFGNSGNGYHFAERPEDTLRYFLNEDEFTIICRYNRASGKFKNVITELSRNNHRLKHLKINCKNSTLIDVDVEQYMYILKFIEETQLFEERFLLRKVL